MENNELLSKFMDLLRTAGEKVGSTASQLWPEVIEAFRVRSISDMVGFFIAILLCTTIMVISIKAIRKFGNQFHPSYTAFHSIILISAILSTIGSVMITSVFLCRLPASIVNYTHPVGGFILEVLKK